MNKERTSLQCASSNCVRGVYSKDLDAVKLWESSEPGMIPIPYASWEEFVAAVKRGEFDNMKEE
jgi:hypothetical protein